MTLLTFLLYNECFRVLQTCVRIIIVVLFSVDFWFRVPSRSWKVLVSVIQSVWLKLAHARVSCLWNALCFPQFFSSLFFLFVGAWNFYTETYSQLVVTFLSPIKTYWRIEKKIANTRRSVNVQFFNSPCCQYSHTT